MPGHQGIPRAEVAGDDPDSFAAELTPLFPAATRLAAGMLLDAAAAEDAVQEAAFRAWRRRANRWPGTDLGPWFLAIVANQCREVRRGRWATILRFAEPPDDIPAPSADAAGAIDVREGLRRLRRDERLALVLRYYLDLPVAEVAAIAGCSVEAAKSRVRRAEASLKSVLSPAEESR